MCSGQCSSQFRHMWLVVRRIKYLPIKDLLVLCCHFTLISFYHFSQMLSRIFFLKHPSQVSTMSSGEISELRRTETVFELCKRNVYKIWGLPQFSWLFVYVNIVVSNLLCRNITTGFCSDSCQVALLPIKNRSWFESLFADLCQPGSFGSTFLTESSQIPLIGVSVSPCSLCSPGFYQPNYGAVDCLPCPSGAQATKRGARNEEDCFRAVRKHPANHTVCHSHSCQNGGSCTLISGYLSCDCSSGFFGENNFSFFSLCNFI